MKKAIQTAVVIGAMILTSFIAHAQIGTNLTPTRPTTPGFQLGWDNSGTAGSLEINNDFSGTGNDINFNTATTPKATILNNGNFGIGTTAPTFKLDVNGNINIPSASAFHLGGLPFLWNNNIPSNLSVGYYAGPGSGFNNTFMGPYAGSSSAGYGNTYVGSYSANTATGAGEYQNTAVGCSTLYQTTKYGGCAFGYCAACSTSTGCGITAMGEWALYQSTTGNYNCAFGHRAGQTLITGANNLFLGNLADVCPTCNSSIQSNSAAIGANAVVSNSNEMILGDNSVYVGIGYSNVASFPPGKLSVDKSAGTVTTPTVSGFFHNGDIQPSAASAFAKKGVYGISDGRFSNTGHVSSLLENIGGDFEATNSDVVNIGVRGRTGMVAHVPTGNQGVGGWFEANNSTYNWGSYSSASGVNQDNIGVEAISNGGAAVNYGLYAYAPAGTCGTGGPCTDAAGFFNGDVYCTTASYFVSDANLKDSIQPLENGMDVIKALSPKSFTFRTSQFPNISLAFGTEHGLIAQDVQNVLPELVGNFKIPPRVDSLGNMDTTGTSVSYLAVNYVGLIPYLIAGAKEQQLKIDSLNTVDSLLNSRLTNLENIVSGCCGSENRHINPGGDGGDQGNSSAIDVELNNAKSIILNQNVPNPFAEQTTISYFITDDVSKAQIFFYDSKGVILKIVDVNEKGSGQLNVYAADLSSGNYTYTLIADGKLIETKKMIKQ